uniref:Tyrosine--tRNA ligase n=1 Tax=Panagrellus redivivus TaxID=6233 RepID=A0A7E4ZS54_PANRE
MHRIAIRTFSSTSSSNLSELCRDLSARGLVENAYPSVADLAGLTPKLPDAAYAGFDPTAESLHVGNLVVVNTLLRAALSGVRSVALVGGATALIGDPAGKHADRPELAKDLVAENAGQLEQLLRRISSNTAEIYNRELPFTVVNNYEWYRDLSMIDFLRLARAFRVGPMLRLGHIKSRMKETTDGAGLTFTEFSYQILQSRDWLVLAQRYGSFFQFGGSDQLGHLDAGAHYIKNVLKKPAAGICLPLITDAHGNKIGKSTTSKGEAVWLSNRLTSPYSFYQYFRQQHDDIAEKLLVYFSLKSMTEISEVLEDHRAQKGKSIAQTALAEELTTIVHGKEGLELARRCSNVLFYGAIDDLKTLDASTLFSLFGSASTFTLPRNEVSTFGHLADATRTDKNKGSQLMTKGAFRVNGKQYLDPSEKLSISDVTVAHGCSLISWGKRKFFLVKWT